MWLFELLSSTHPSGQWKKMLIADNPVLAAAYDPLVWCVWLIEAEFFARLNSNVHFEQSLALVATEGPVAPALIQLPRKAVMTWSHRSAKKNTRPSGTDSVASESFQDSMDAKRLELDPREAVDAQPGSERKVSMLAARYAAGLPLWHEDDCDDHSAASV